MKRDLKFRTWDGIRMSTNYIAFNSSTGELFTPKEYSLSGGTIPLDKQMPIMQFTGLYDKNNVPIYEGDIVKSFDEVLTVIFNQYTASFDVMYDYPKGDCEQIMVNEHSALEVIGNIYENPELLSK